jgi:tRNA G37 N-methylase TrmD
MTQRVKMECHCGCGEWFWQERKPGRRVLYLNGAHKHVEKYRREVKRGRRGEAARLRRPRLWNARQAHEDAPGATQRPDP